MIRQLLTIARNTFLESIRQPICAVVVLVGVLMLLFAPLVSAYTMGDDTKFLIDISMSTILLANLFLAALLASSVLSDEIENRTVLTTISKPVARPIFVLGKFLGVTAAAAVGFWVMTLVYLLTVRHGVMSTASDRFDGPVLTFGFSFGLIALLFSAWMNYYHRWRFTAALMVSLAIALTSAWLMVLLFDKHWDLQPITAEFTLEDSVLGQLHIALFLVFEITIFLVAVAIAASTRLGKVMAVMVTLGVGPIVAAGASFLKVMAQRSSEAEVANVVARVVPNLQYFWLTDSLIDGTTVSFSYVMLISAYATLLIAAALSLAIALFQTREVG